jgi:hypothetical protein
MDSKTCDRAGSVDCIPYQPLGIVLPKVNGFLELEHKVPLPPAHGKGVKTEPRVLHCITTHHKLSQMHIKTLTRPQS